MLSTAAMRTTSGWVGFCNVDTSSRTTALSAGAMGRPRTTDRSPVPSWARRKRARQWSQDGGGGQGHGLAAGNVGKVPGAYHRRKATIAPGGRPHAADVCGGGG